MAGDDVLHVQDLIDRFEDLDADHDGDNAPAGEYEALRDLLRELAGNGGGVYWRGRFYPDELHVAVPAGAKFVGSVQFDGVRYWYEQI